jgi:hypothetical protein
MKKQMTQAEAQAIVNKVQAKIDKFLEARRIAEAAFDKLQKSPEWEQICELTGMSASSDFGDWTC